MGGGDSEEEIARRKSFSKTVREIDPKVLGMSGSLSSILRAVSGLLGFLMLGHPEGCISEGYLRVVQRSLRKLSKATRGQFQIFRLSKKSSREYRGCERTFWSP